MSFLLDTNICIYALKQNQVVLKRLLAERPIDVAVSVITQGELRVGATKSVSAAKTTRLLD
jgi:predicted nucleic acid-binding protein